MNNKQYNENLFEKIRGQFSNVTIANDKGEVVLNPSDGMFFEFTFDYNGQSLGDVVISLAEDDMLKVYFSNDMLKESDSSTRDAWYNFLREMRKFAARNIVNFETRNISKPRLDKKDFEFLLRKRQDNLAMESKLYGSKQKSYQDLNGAKLIVQHHKTVDEEKHGARSRNIKAIYIENAQGERFRFENNYLPGARAMARHIANEGWPNDDRGKHLSEIMAEMSQLKNFVKAVKSKEYVDEEASEIIDAATDRYYGLKSTLESLSKQRGYVNYFENWQANQIDVDENDINNIKQKLTRSEYDERLDDSLSAVGKAMKLKEKKQGGVYDFGKWQRMAKSAGAEVKGDVKSAVAYKDGVEIGSWSQDEEDLDAKYGSDVKDPGYGEINLDTGDRGEGDERAFEMPDSLNMIPGDNVIKIMQFSKGDKIGPITAVLRDISARSRDDETSVFTADMAQRIASVGTTFGQKMDDAFKAKYMQAIDLVKMYIATTDKSESVENSDKAQTEDLLANFERSMNHIEEGFVDSQEAAEQVIASIGGEENLTMDDVYKAVEEYVQMGAGDDMHKANVEEIAEIVIDQLGITEAAKPDYLDLDKDGDKEEQLDEILPALGAMAAIGAAGVLANKAVDKLNASKNKKKKKIVIDQPGITEAAKPDYLDLDKDGDKEEQLDEILPALGAMAIGALANKAVNKLTASKNKKKKKTEETAVTEAHGMVCKDCGCHMHRPDPNCDCPHDCNDEQGAHWVMAEGKMSDIDLHVREMIADGASDEEIMAMHPGVVSKEDLKSIRAEEMDRPGEYDESLDWLKKAAGIGSSARSNFGIKEGEPGYQKSLRDEIGKYLEGLK